MAALIDSKHSLNLYTFTYVLILKTPSLPKTICQSISSWLIQTLDPVSSPPPPTLIAPSVLSYSHKHFSLPPFPLLCFLFSPKLPFSCLAEGFYMHSLLVPPSPSLSLYRPHSKMVKSYTVFILIKTIFPPQLRSVSPLQPKSLHSQSGHSPPPLSVVVTQICRKG